MNDLTKQPLTLTGSASLYLERTLESGAPRTKMIVPDYLASQRFELVSLSSGVNVFLCEMFFDKPRIHDYAANHEHSFAIGFMLSGDISFNHGDKGSLNYAHNSPVSAFYSTHDIQGKICYAAGSPIRYMSIMFDREVMHRLLGEDVGLLPATIRRYRPALKQRIHMEALRPAMSLAAHQALGRQLKGPHSKLFLESKVLELITLYLQGLALENNKSPAACSNNITLNDRDRLLAARDILKAEMADPPTIAVLARRLGINEPRLKHLFKIYFGITIYGYVQKERMCRAKTLLEEGLSVSETASHIGFVNFSHFAAAFRRYHGDTPSAFKYQK